MHGEGRSRISDFHHQSTVTHMLLNFELSRAVKVVWTYALSSLFYSFVVCDGRRQGEKKQLRDLTDYCFIIHLQGFCLNPTTLAIFRSTEISTFNRGTAWCCAHVSHIEWRKLGQRVPIPFMACNNNIAWRTSNTLQLKRKTQRDLKGKFHFIYET